MSYTKKTPAQLKASYAARAPKISAALTARYAVQPAAKHTQETRERIRQAITGIKRTPEQRETLRQAKLKYWAEHKLPAEVQKARTRKRKAAAQKKNRRAWKARRMGAPPGAAEQKHCDACGTTDVFEMGKRNHHLDHCHDTGRFRGVLCGFCNVVLGKAQKKPARFALLGGGLLAYAKEHGCI